METFTIELSKNDGYLIKSLCEHIANHRRIMPKESEDDEDRYMSDIYNLSHDEIKAMYEIAEKFHTALHTSM